MLKHPVYLLAGTGWNCLGVKRFLKTEDKQSMSSLHQMQVVYTYTTGLPEAYDDRICLLDNFNSQDTFP